MSSANSMEVGVLGPSEGAEWEQWLLDDTARAELPLSSSRQETLPVGMALDTSAQHNLPWGEHKASTLTINVGLHEKPMKKFVVL